jgi:hypothetical protein
MHSRAPALALLAGASLALTVLVLGLLIGAAGAFGGDSLAGSAGLLAAIEAGIVVVALLFVLLAS